ncbi:MAG: YkgJ family cysteine cluster protein [Saprospiraceae bacterium]|nr:YkgJ family cysteine cluster protein [Saprospiraceae bacterium]
MDLVKHNQLVDNKKKENQAFFKKLKNQKSKNLDQDFHELHDEAFEKIDCLACANCCKTTSPMLFPKDIERLANATKMKPSAFTDKYLKIDEDGDFVFQSAPCPFLGADNYCSVYEDRPKACREYPHTNRKNMYQILDLTYKNIKVCPAVYSIVENLKKIS